MRRPWLATTVAAFQTLLGLALIATALTLVVAAKSATPRDTGDFAAAGILGAIGLLVLASCWGLWRMMRWGRWMALTIDVIGLVTFLWDPITRRVKPDTDEIAFIVLFAVLVVLLILVSVRKSSSTLDKPPSKDQLRNLKI